MKANKDERKELGVDDNFETAYSMAAWLPHSSAKRRLHHLRCVQADKSSGLSGKMNILNGSTHDTQVNVRLLHRKLRRTALSDCESVQVLYRYYILNANNIFSDRK